MTTKYVVTDEQDRIFHNRIWELGNRWRKNILEPDATLDGLQVLAENKLILPANAVKVSFSDCLVRKTAKMLSKRFGKKITVDSLPTEFTEENLARWAKFNLHPIFLPNEEISENRNLKNWVKPNSWFYAKIKGEKIASDSPKLKNGWYLADFTPSVDYDDGKQVYPNDPLSPIIACLREQVKIGKYDQTPMGSRFSIVPKDEWPLVFAELAKKIDIKSKQIRLERAIEFNAIGNLYDKNRCRFNSWEWFADDFEFSNRLCGGLRDRGGLANVRHYWFGSRDDDIAGRPLVSF